MVKLLMNILSTGIIFFTSFQLTSCDGSENLAPKTIFKDIQEYIPESLFNISETSANPFWRSALRELKIDDPFNGNTLGGVRLEDWFYFHQNVINIMMSYFSSNNKYLSSEEDQARRIEYTNIIRSWKWGTIKEKITKFARKYWNERSYIETVNSFQELRSRHLDMVRHDYFVRRWNHKKIPHLIPQKDSKDEYNVKNEYRV